MTGLILIVCISDIYSDYSKLLLHLEHLNLLEAYAFKPILDGNALSKALATKPGPWMKPALDAVVTWQLKNPHKTDASEVIEDLKAKQGELSKHLALHFLQLTIRPLFAKTRHPSITSAGRKSMNEDINHKFVQLEIDDTDSRPWKYDGYSLDLLTYIMGTIDVQMVKTNWHLLLPTIFIMIDDTSAVIKAKACIFLSLLLRKTDTAFLAQTGLFKVIEDAVFPCVHYLPGLTPEEECIPLLLASYRTLLYLADMQGSKYSQGEDKKSELLDKMMRKGVLYGLFYAKENVKVAEVLLDQLRQITDSLGIRSVKHLKNILPSTTEILAEPLGPAYPPLLLSAVRCLKNVILLTWPRVHMYRAEILKGIVACWIRIATEPEMEELRSEIVITVKALQVASGVKSNETDEDIKKLTDTSVALQELFSKAAN